MKFNGDPQQLGFLLAQVLTYVQEYGDKIPIKGAKVRVITLALEGAAVRWMVTLHNGNAPELRNFNRFMSAMRWQFEDSLADRKTRDHIRTDHIRTVRQGCRPAAEYTEEFQDLACHFNWLEDILMNCFKDGLNLRPVYHVCCK